MQTGRGRGNTGFLHGRALPFAAHPRHARKHPWNRKGTRWKNDARLRALVAAALGGSGQAFWFAGRALRAPELQRVRQVPDRPAAIIDACRPDLDESQRRMESIRCRVWRAAVDFTDNALVSGFSRMFEQIAIKPARAAASARR